MSASIFASTAPAGSTTPPARAACRTSHCSAKRLPCRDAYRSIIQRPYSSAVTGCPSIVITTPERAASSGAAARRSTDCAASASPTTIAAHIPRILPAPKARSLGPPSAA